MTKTVRRRRTQDQSLVLFLQFLTARKAEADAKKERERLRDQLTEFVETEGNHEVDPEKGHLLHTLPEEIDFFGQKFKGFQREKKAGGQVFLEDKAEALCEKKGFDPDEYTTRYVDQDKIVRLYADDKITKAEFDRLYETQDPTWAFVPVKA
jgi:hypothetical protein